MQPLTKDGKTYTMINSTNPPGAGRPKSLLEAWGLILRKAIEKVKKSAFAQHSDATLYYLPSKVDQRTKEFRARVKLRTEEHGLVHGSMTDCLEGMGFNVRCPSKKMTIVPERQAPPIFTRNLPA